jgi:hypothetical protein
MRVTPRWCVPAVLFFSALLCCPSGAWADVLQVVLRDSGKLLWEGALEADAGFILEHRNSIYGMQVRERFRIDSDGGIRLDAVQTESPAVLEYYGLEEVSCEWIPLSRRIGAIRMIHSRRGEIRIHLADRWIRLSDFVPDGVRIEIRVRR